MKWIKCKVDDDFDQWAPNKHSAWLGFQVDPTELALCSEWEDFWFGYDDYVQQLGDCWFFGKGSLENWSGVCPTCLFCTIALVLQNPWHFVHTTCLSLVEFFRHQSFCLLFPLETTFASRYSGDSAGMTQQADGSYVVKWGSQRE